MAVDWSSYRLAPDFSGLAAGIQGYFQNRQAAEIAAANQAMEQQKMGMEQAYKDRMLAIEEQKAMRGGNAFRPNILGGELWKGENGRLYKSMVVGDANDPLNSYAVYVDYYSGKPVPPDQVENLKLSITTPEAESADVRATGEAKVAGARQSAINAADISSIYQKTAEQKRAENDALLASTAEKANTAYEMMVPLFEQIDSILSNKKKEIYSGKTWDYVTGTVAPKLGVVFDQNKLNDTITVRQNIATLRTMSKPAGSGNPTEGEWARFDGMLPDPNTATRGELVTGYNNYVKAVNNWYQQNRERGAKGVVSKTPSNVTTVAAPAQQPASQSKAVIDYNQYED